MTNCLDSIKAYTEPRVNSAQSYPNSADNPIDVKEQVGKTFFPACFFCVNASDRIYLRQVEVKQVTSGSVNPLRGDRFGYRFFQVPFIG